MKRGLSQNLSRIMSAELSKYDAVVITGASSGIGRALAGLVLSLCDVKLCNISRNIPDDFKDRENFLHVPCDLKNPDEIDSAFQKVLEHIDIYKEKQRYPKILLVNNSGFGAYGEFPEPDIRQNCEMIDVNVRALTKLCGLFMPLIKKGGGSIVNIASTAAFQPCPQLSAYAAGKSYVLSFSLALSYELKKYGAKCLCVWPLRLSGAYFQQLFQKRGLRQAAASGKFRPPAAGRGRCRAEGIGERQTAQDCGLHKQHSGSACQIPARGASSGCVGCGAFQGALQIGYWMASMQKTCNFEALFAECFDNHV